MKILLDEMLAGLKEYFEILGWDVITAQESGLRGSKDRAVVEYAVKNKMLLVTEDQKPAELMNLKGAMYVLISNSMIAKMVDKKIREKYPYLKPE